MSNERWCWWYPASELDQTPIVGEVREGYDSKEACIDAAIENNEGYDHYVCVAKMRELTPSDLIYFTDSDFIEKMLDDADSESNVIGIDEVWIDFNCDEAGRKAAHDEMVGFLCQWADKYLKVRPKWVIPSDYEMLKLTGDEFRVSKLENDDHPED